MYVTTIISWVKALANEDTLLRTHCCRHKCFPVCPRAQHLSRTQICVWNTKMFLILFRNVLCPQQMFPSLRSPRNVMNNTVSSFARALKRDLVWPLGFNVKTTVLSGAACMVSNGYSISSRASPTMKARQILKRDKRPRPVLVCCFARFCFLWRQIPTSCHRKRSQLPVTTTRF